MTKLTEQQRLLAVALKRKNQLAVAQCFDPVNLASRPTAAQQELLGDIETIPHRYAVCANQSGKSATGAREVSWVWTETHPKWKRPARWGDEPLLLIVVARTTKQIEDNLWRKIRAYVDPTEYKIQNVAGVIQKVTHTPTGNTILFASHHADNEAREKLQAFVAHYVWVDEMPKSITLLEELHRRVQSRRGYFLATFTPKVRNDQIRKLVDASKEPYSKKYNFLMFDNPVLTDEDKERILFEMESHPVSYRNTILYGDWSAGETTVYDFNHETMICDPKEYSKAWRHVLSIDPAMSGKAGVTLWAEEPSTGVWYLVRDEYVEGKIAPDDVVMATEKIAQGYNIIRRISDPHETWYIGAASKLGYTYLGVYKKNDRKSELIKNSQTALSKGEVKISSWCTLFTDELISCHWSEKAENKIVNASKFHLLDSFQYFTDLKPREDRVAITQTHDQWLRETDRKRHRKEQEAKIKIQRGGRLKRRQSWARS